MIVEFTNFVLDFIKGPIDRLKAHAAKTWLKARATNGAPVLFGLAAYVIVDFYFRVARGYRYYHPRMVQKVGITNILLTVIPILVPLFLLFKKGVTGLEPAVYGFTMMANILSVAYPFVVETKAIVFGSFFPITMMFGALLTVTQHVIWFFCVFSIFFAILKFKNEVHLKDKIRRYVFFPVLAFGFTTLMMKMRHVTKVFDDAKDLSIWSTFAGCFIALLINRKD